MKFYNALPVGRADDELALGVALWGIVALHGRGDDGRRVVFVVALLAVRAHAASLSVASEAVSAEGAVALAMVERVLQRLGATPEQMFINVTRYGNTSAASVAIALDEARKQGVSLPVTALVDQFYAEVENLGGKRWDTSSLFVRQETARKGNKS